MLLKLCYIAAAGLCPAAGKYAYNIIAKVTDLGHNCKPAADCFCVLHGLGCKHKRNNLPTGAIFYTILSLDITIES
jgi:hypothetical protein